ncbi:MAG: DUF4864 domain-containing protein, partial [Betaproteobacteria bacterium]
ALGAALSPAAATLAHAVETKLSKADWQAIRKVISRQLAALRAGDGKRAFGYASPGIQAQFGDAQTFMVMVRAGYSALLDARYTEFLEGAVMRSRRVPGGLPAANWHRRRCKPLKEPNRRGTCAASPSAPGATA